MDRVSYRYEPEMPLVLDGVSFEAKAGEYVAIVGPSGSGKSTLVRLLLGFAEPENGSILFDGRPLTGLDPRSVRRQIGTVLQSNSLFSASMMDVFPEPFLPTSLSLKLLAPPHALSGLAKQPLPGAEAR